MGQIIQDGAARLSETQLESLKSRVRDASGQMSDDQILALADSLHTALRTRRDIRHRFKAYTEAGLSVALA